MRLEYNEAKIKEKAKNVEKGNWLKIHHSWK